MIAALSAVALGAAALSAGLVRALHPVFVRYALARPNARSSHAVPTPQGGGIPVLAGTLLASGLGLASFAGPEATLRLWPVAGGALLLAAVGGLDDVRPLSPAIRLLAQALAVAGIVWAVDPGPILPGGLPAWLERGLLVLAGTWWVNLTNFMDGIDWMTCAAFVPMAGALALFGLAGWLPAAPAFVAAGLLGGLGGFAPANRPVARLFLGDVGSLPLGLLTGWLLLELAAAGGLAAALVLPLYYAADATLTLLSRLRRRERVWEAHREHFYQRALRGGWPVLRIDRAVLLLSVALAGCAAVSLALPGRSAAAAALLAGAAAVAWTLRRFLRPPGRSS